MVLVNATTIGRRLGGIGRYALSLARRLLATRRADLRVFVNECALVHFTAEERSRVIRVGGGVSPDFGFKGHLLRLLWSNRLRVLNPEGVIFHTSPLEGCVIGSRQVLTVHDLIPLQFPRDHRKQYRYFKYWLPRVLARTSGVIAVSNSTKRELAAAYGYPASRIRVIYHGIEDIFRQPDADAAKGNYLLYVGRRAPTKNIHRLLDAYAQVRRRHGQLVLKVVGSHDLRVEGRHGVEVLGWVPDPDLVRLYRGAQLLAYPSLAEGFGLPPLEAMACGCPVVAAKIPAIMEACEDAAWYVSPDSTESIVEGICRVLCDGDLRRRLSERGLERSRAFSWEAAVEQHLGLFQQVLSDDYELRCTEGLKKS